MVYNHGVMEHDLLLPLNHPRFVLDKTEYKFLQCLLSIFFRTLWNISNNSCFVLWTPGLQLTLNLIKYNCIIILSFIVWRKLLVGTSANFIDILINHAYYLFLCISATGIARSVSPGQGLRGVVYSSSSTADARGTPAGTWLAGTNEQPASQVIFNSFIFCWSKHYHTWLWICNSWTSN